MGAYGVGVEGLAEEEVAEDLVAHLGHLELVVLGAVVLEGQDHRVVRRQEGRVANRIDTVLHQERHTLTTVLNPRIHPL